MQRQGIPVTYVLYPDEGHGFARPENRMSFNAVTEAFLAEHLGGRVEPIGEDFAGAKFEVGEGAAHVPGLAAALPGRDALRPAAVTRSGLGDSELVTSAGSVSVPDGPIPVTWMITSPSFAHTKCGVFFGSEKNVPVG